MDNKKCDINKYQLNLYHKNKNNPNNFFIILVNNVFLKVIHVFITMPYLD